MNTSVNILTKNDILSLIVAIKDNDINFIENFCEIFIPKYGEQLLSYEEPSLVGGFINLAVNESAVETLELLIKLNFDLHLKDSIDIDCAFKYACLNKKYEHIEKLLDASPMKFSTSNEVILEYICKNNDLKLLTFLFNNRKKDLNYSKDNPFIFKSIEQNFNNACFYGYYDIVQFLINQNYIIKNETPFVDSFNLIEINIIGLLIKQFQPLLTNLFNNNSEAHHQIFSYMEKNKFINEKTLINIYNLLYKIQFDFILLDKNKYPKTYSIIEKIYLENLLPSKQDGYHDKIQKI